MYFSYIFRLFTSVPDMETIDICTNVLYHCYFSTSSIPEYIFIQLRKFATMSVEFCFNGIMYWQIHGFFFGIGMGKYFCVFLWKGSLKNYKFIFVYLMAHFVLSVMRWKVFYFLLPSVKFIQPLSLNEKRKIIFLYPF